METYILRIKEIANNFSYHQFIDLMKELDNEIISGNIQEIEPEFLYYFNQIMGLVNDKYVVDNKPGTLGHMLVENTLMSKQKISPTLMMYFYLEQKGNLGLNNTYNNIKFTNSEEVGTMGVTIGTPFTLKLNLDYLKKETEVDNYNYEIMEGLLHEVTHIYQYSIPENTENLFDKLTYYDVECYLAIFKYLNDTERNIIYSSVLSEFMANEQARAYMLSIADNHPEYFNEKLIEQKKIQYIQERKNAPRQQFSESLGFLKFLYREKMHEIQPFFDSIKTILTDSSKIEEQLKTLGISEDLNYSYFSIFLNSPYQFDGENIVIANEIQNKNSKGI